MSQKQRNHFSMNALESVPDFVHMKHVKELMDSFEKNTTFAESFLPCKKSS
jgi:hypothetical protein